MTTMLVTFACTVGLALVVLLSVAAAPMRRRGSRLIDRLDTWADRFLPLVHAWRERAARALEARVRERLDASRTPAGEERGTAPVR